MTRLIVLLGLAALLLTTGVAALYACRRNRALAPKATWWPFRRRWVRLAGFGVLLGLCAGFFIDLSPSRRINRRAFDRIRPGMTRAQVEALLGPPGDYFSRSTQADRDPDYGWVGPSIKAVAPWQPHGPAIPAHDEPGEWLEWSGDNGGIALGFDGEGKVAGKTFHFAHIRIRWLGWVLFDTGIFWNDYPFNVRRHYVDW